VTHAQNPIRRLDHHGPPRAHARRSRVAGTEGGGGGSLSCPRTVEVTIGAPAGLEVWTLEAGPDQFALLQWPCETTLPAERLSGAERQVLALLLDGCSNAEVAAIRNRSTRTIGNQVASMFRKLGVGSRSELFAALANGRTPGTGGAPQR
jgi:DNA-binding CsgD family transcriptional regulator